MRSSRLGHYFFIAVGILLISAAAAKIYSAGGTSTVLYSREPVFGFSFKELFIFVGALELVVGFLCFFWKSDFGRAVLVAWLASSFIMYKFGLYLLHYESPCPCLGNLTEQLGIHSQSAEIALQGVTLFMLIGGALLLLRSGVSRRKV